MRLKKETGAKRVLHECTFIQCPLSTLQSTYYSTMAAWTFCLASCASGFAFALWAPC